MSGLDRTISLALNIVMVEVLFLAVVWAANPQLSTRQLLGFAVLSVPVAWVIGVRIHWIFSE